MWHAGDDELRKRLHDRDQLCRGVPVAAVRVARDAGTLTARPERLRPQIEAEDQPAREHPQTHGQWGLPGPCLTARRHSRSRSYETVRAERALSDHLLVEGGCDRARG